MLVGVIHDAGIKEDFLFVGVLIVVRITMAASRAAFAISAVTTCIAGEKKYPIEDQ
jgi:hypothetical protein